MFENAGRGDGLALASGIGVPTGVAIEVVGAAEFVASGICTMDELKLAEVAGGAKGHFDEDVKKWQDLGGNKFVKRLEL